MMELYRIHAYECAWSSPRNLSCTLCKGATGYFLTFFRVRESAEEESPFLEKNFKFFFGFPEGEYLYIITSL